MLFFTFYIPTPLAHSCQPSLRVTHAFRMILPPKSAQGKSSRISHACRRISQNQENIAGEYRRISDAKFTLTGLTKILTTCTRLHLSACSFGKLTRKSQRIMCPPQIADQDVPMNHNLRGTPPPRGCFGVDLTCAMFNIRMSF